MENIKTKMQLYGNEAKITREINKYIPEKDHCEILIHKENDNWVITLTREKESLVTITAKEKEEALKLLAVWMKYLYEEMRYSRVSIELTHPKNYEAILKRRNNVIDEIHEEKESDFYRELKKKILQENLHQSPIKVLLSAGDLTPTEEEALKMFLLGSTFVEIKKEGTQIKTTLEEENRLPTGCMDIEIKLINPLTHPALFKLIKEEEARIIIRENEDLTFYAILLNKRKDPEEMVVSKNIKELINELEIKIREEKIERRKKKYE